MPPSQRRHIHKEQAAVVPPTQCSPCSGVADKATLMLAPVAWLAEIWQAAGSYRSCQCLGTVTGAQVARNCPQLDGRTGTPPAQTQPRVGLDSECNAVLAHNLKDILCMIYCLANWFHCIGIFKLYAV